jgi:hypothetical protein
VKADKVNRAFNDQNFQRKKPKPPAPPRVEKVDQDGRPWWATAPRAGFTAIATARAAQ